MGQSLFHSCGSVLERLASVEAVVGLFPIGIIEASRKSRTRLFKDVTPFRVNFPLSSTIRCDEETAEAIARVAGLSHISVSTL